MVKRCKGAIRWVVGLVATVAILVPAPAGAGSRVERTTVAWLDGLPLGIAVFGEGFPIDVSCTLQAFRAVGPACWTASFDALAGIVETDADGTLTTRRGGQYDELPLAWACLDGRCPAGTTVSGCHDDLNPLERIRVTCGVAVRDVALADPFLTFDPPSAGLVVRAAAGDGGFDLTATLHAADATPLSFCSVRVATLASDGEADILERARGAIQASAACAAAGVAAAVDPGPAPRLRLLAPALSGTELVPAVHVAPGDANGRCFSLGDLGIAVADQALMLAVEFRTAPAGAAGGTITVAEHAPLGVCTTTTTTLPGMSAPQIANAVRARFQQGGIPGPAACPSAENPRDVVVNGTRIRTTLATEVEICVNDAGVGFGLEPEGLGSSHPIAACASQVVECVANGRAPVLLDGSGSRDPDGDPLVLDWYLRYGTPQQVHLGTGTTLDADLPFGRNEVTVVATGAEGQADRATCAVNVVDTTPPVIPQAYLTPSVLFPPHHELVDVTATIDAYDACRSATVTLASIASSEPDDAPGDADGATLFDVQDAEVGTPDLALHLRAERDGSGAGRTYHVVYEARDPSNNVQVAELEVEVPLDLGGVVEPIVIRIEKTTAPQPAARVEWTNAGPGQAYDVLRGSVRNLTPYGGGVYLGPVECLAVGTLARQIDHAPHPASGEVWFYLVQAIDFGVERGFSTETAPRPRRAPPCRPDPDGPIPDPERDSIVPTTWHWWLNRTETEVKALLAVAGDRPVDVDRIDFNRYHVAQVRDSGSTYGWPSFWFADLNPSQVIEKIESLNGRLLDLHRFVDGLGDTRFSVSIIPNEGKRQKAWWWNFDATREEVEEAIATHDLRLIHLEAYEVGLFQTRYAFVGILNEGIDEKTWWPMFDVTHEELRDFLAETGGRLMDIGRRPDGRMTAIVVASEGKAWWWDVDVSQERIAMLVATKGARLIDLERWEVLPGEERFAFVAIDDVATEEARRLRPFLEEAFDAGSFGPNVTRGFLVKEVGGQSVAEIAADLPFQPASTLKLLPYLVAWEDVDRGLAGLGTTVTIVTDPAEPGNGCPASGTSHDETFEDALPTLIWYSDGPTLEGFFRRYPPFDPNPAIDTLTRRAHLEFGLFDTEMHLGCPTDPDENWLANRSTLRDFSRLYEGVETGAFLDDDAASRDLFFGNLINEMQDNCAANPFGSPGCDCPVYEPNCTGNFYDSPYIDAGAGPAMIGYLYDIVAEEGGAGFPIYDFLDQVIVRSKGGGASVANFPTPGFWDGYRSLAMFATLPFKDGTGQIVPRSFTLGFFANNWDGSCGGDLGCAAAIQAEDSQLFNTTKAEFFRVPIRMAIDTW